MGECWLFLFLFSFWVIDFLYMVYIILKTQKSLQNRRMFLLLFLSQDRKQQLCNRFPPLGSPESEQWKCTLFAAPEFLIEMTHFCNLPLTADRILRDHYFLFLLIALHLYGCECKTFSPCLSVKDIKVEPQPLSPASSSCSVSSPQSIDSCSSTQHVPVSGQSTVMNWVLMGEAADIMCFKEPYSSEENVT